MTATPKELSVRTVTLLVIIAAELCYGSDSQKPYGPSAATNGQYQNNNYDAEFQRPLAVFTERPVNVAGFVLTPVVQVPSSDLRMIYRPQIDSVSKTEPIVMCKSSSKSVEATPAVQVPLQQPFYLYDERTMIPFPKTVTILHGGYRMLIPVGVVVAPVPSGAFKSGPVLVTTLFAIPAGPLPTPLQIPLRFVPWSPYPTPPQQPISGPSSPSQYSALPSPPQYSTPAVHLPPQYSAASPAAHQATPLYLPSPPAPYSPQTPYSPPASYSPPTSFSPQTSYTSPTSYSPPTPYSQPAPPAPAYYQHEAYTEDNGNDDLRYRDPPGKLYSQYTAGTPFHNSKESPVLNQLREESEKSRKKYASQPPPPYSNLYQTIDA